MINNFIINQIILGGRDMKFIGRRAELDKLNAEFDRSGSFVVIYGRRRVASRFMLWLSNSSVTRK